MRFKDYLRRQRAPLVIYLELTHRCSFLCTHCYIPEALRWPSLEERRQPIGLSTDEVKRLLDQLAECKTLFLVFTGGEIFLRPDLEEITEYAVGLGFAVKYYTNGFHVTPRWADTIKRLGVYGVDISVYGANEATYAAVTQVKGGFQRVVTTLGYLHERGIRTVVKTPVLKQNFRDIAQIKQLAERFKAIFRYDMVIIPRFDGDETPYQYRLEDHEIETLLAEMGARFEQPPVPLEESPACSVARWSAVVSPQGEVYPCIELRRSLGNVRQHSFREIWLDNPDMHRIREALDNMPAASAVFGDGLCGHCPAYSLHSTGDMTQPSPEHQRIAAVKRRFITGSTRQEE